MFCEAKHFLAGLSEVSVVQSATSFLYFVQLSALFHPFSTFLFSHLSYLRTDKEVLRNDILNSKWLWGQKFDHPRVRKSAKGNFAENALSQVMTVWRYQISKKLRFSSKIRNLLQNWWIWTVKKTNCSIFNELFEET